MKIKRDGVVMDPKKNTESTEYASDELIDKISEEIEEEYAEAFRLLAKGPNNIWK